MKTIRLYGRMLLLGLTLLLFTACATQLAPYYDRALVEGLTEANVELMRFVASISEGTEEETYEQRQDGYTALVGWFEALSIQARARPQPSNRVIERFDAFLEERGLPVPDDSDVPSAIAMDEVVETLKFMMRTDGSQGLTATEVQAFKNQLAIYLDQALTYESFLER